MHIPTKCLNKSTYANIYVKARLKRVVEVIVLQHATSTNAGRGVARGDLPCPARRLASPSRSWHHRLASVFPYFDPLCSCLVRIHRIAHRLRREFYHVLNMAVCVLHCPYPWNCIFVRHGTCSCLQFCFCRTSTDARPCRL